MINNEEFDAIEKFLDSNPNLDLNIAPEVFATFPSELPLHLACRQGNEKSVERLLAAGANPESFCGHGCNALQCTAQAESLDEKVLMWLTKRYERSEKAKYINLPDQSQDRRATHYAAEGPNQRLEGAMALMIARADWTLKDKKGNTPFEWAAKHDNWIFASYLANSWWNIGDGDIKTDANYPGCHWKRVSVQNVSGKSAYEENVLSTNLKERLLTSK